MEKNKFYQKKWFAWVCLILLAPVGIFLMWRYKHHSVPLRSIASVIFGLIFLVAIFSDDTNEVSQNESDQEVVETTGEVNEPIEENETTEVEEDHTEILEFNGEMSLETADSNVTVNINSNVPDGGIFEVTVVNGNFDVVSEFLEIKGGSIKHTFDISDWPVGYISGIASLRFNYEENPQPEHIKAIYGETGEKMTGELVQENHLDGYNGVISIDTVPYPDETTVLAKQSELFDEAINEMISLGEGIIKSIKPMTGDDWKIVDVVISDAWYHSQEYEKERFAEQVGNAIENIVLNSGKATGTVSVYFKDEYGKEVATPKILGGYNIKR
ncbi:hypothetical protein BKP37_12935 [Anaerobacillus alkalilacustris]|uniref:Uncharacterized protein n=1 Tax=Anaerobacillus alkalilacustris TaxID=393763 RepID=A0A1S2LJI9_9BACI|nr:MerC domain-containing protein [Anaerobacillus alkalilacustris]OIJ12699.1 hypothetical protein BKP37_12935 [Anaerobacillus alkalilacustris]